MQELIRILMFTTILTVFGLQANTWAQTSTTSIIVEEFSELPAETLRDKIRGGLLGQILGNLNGIEHEMEYIAEPGDVKSYVPALPEGARTDDDTDFEWVYICAMQDEGTLFLSYSKIAELWQTRINRGIWCSNQYARVLMDLGFEPPLTGNLVLNPWADFNISGQFLCETFGLLAPGMPRTAEEIGLHYTRVAIDGEPAQTTQLFTAMISQAFLSSDIDALLDVGLKAVDAKSEIYQIVQDVRVWHSTYPENWRKTRQLVKDKYSRYGGEMRDKNGYELNTASTIAALLYGGGDFPGTLRTAFNFGWDADNTAATAGTIVGVTLGYRGMMQQGWQIVDRYKNTKRERMPKDETITSFADRLVDIAKQTIIQQGGKRFTEGFVTKYRIPVQQPDNIRPMPMLEEERNRLRDEWGDMISGTILTKTSGNRAKAKAAYLAIALDLAEKLRKKHPSAWQNALDALETFPQVAQVLYHHSPVPLAEPIRNRALNAGLMQPERQEEEWLWQQTLESSESIPKDELLSKIKAVWDEAGRKQVPDRWWETAAGIKLVSLKKGRTFAHEISIDPAKASKELDRIKAEGFQAIEIFAPAQGLYAYSGLDTTNHYRIDPEIGTMDDFRQFIRIAHSKGLAVIAFVNIGYFSLEAPDWIEACKNPQSEKAKWFIWADSPDAPIPPEHPYFNWPREPESSEKTWGWQYSDLAGRYFWAKWQAKKPDRSFVGLPQNDWGSDEWPKEAERIVRFWMDTGLDGLTIDAPIYYIGMTWEKNNRHITNVIASYGNTFRQPEGSQQVGWITEGNYNCMIDYGIAEWTDDGEDAIDVGIKSGDPRPIEDVLRRYRDVRVAHGSVLYKTVRSYRDVRHRHLYRATLAATGEILVYTRRAGSPDTEETWILNTKAQHPAMQQLASRRKLNTNADDKYYAFLCTAVDKSERILVVLNFQDSGETVEVDLSGVNTTKLVELKSGQLIKHQEVFKIELPAFGYKFFKILPSED